MRLLRENGNMPYYYNRLPFVTQRLLWFGSKGLVECVAQALLTRQAYYYRVESPYEPLSWSTMPSPIDFLANPSLAEKPMSDTGLNVGHILGPLNDRNDEFREAVGNGKVTDVSLEVSVSGSRTKGISYFR